MEMAQTEAQLGIVDTVLGKCFQLIKGGLQTVFNLANQPLKPSIGLDILYLEFLLFSLFLSAFAP